MIEGTKNKKSVNKVTDFLESQNDSHSALTSIINIANKKTLSSLLIKK